MAQRTHKVAFHTSRTGNTQVCTIDESDRIEEAKEGKHTQIDLQAAATGQRRRVARNTGYIQSPPQETWGITGFLGNPLLPGVLELEVGRAVLGV